MKYELIKKINSRKFFDCDYTLSIGKLFKNWNLVT